jgi:hypothetical protein
VSTPKSGTQKRTGAFAFTVLSSITMRSPTESGTSTRVNVCAGLFNNPNASHGYVDQLEITDWAYGLRAHQAGVKSLRAGAHAFLIRRFWSLSTEVTTGSSGSCDIKHVSSTTSVRALNTHAAIFSLRASELNLIYENAFK